MMQSQSSEDSEGTVFYGSKRMSRHEYSLKLYSVDVQVCLVQYNTDNTVNAVSILIIYAC